MRKPVTVKTINDMKSLAFDYNVPVFVDPAILISGDIKTDTECDQLIANITAYHPNAVAFYFVHEGFRIYFLTINSFVVLKKYTINEGSVCNFKLFGLLSIRFNNGDDYQWTDKEYYDYKRNNKPHKISRNSYSYQLKYKHVYDKIYVSEITVTNYLYVVDMKFNYNGREIGLNSLANDYPELVNALRGKIKSVDNLSNRNKAIKEYISVIDMILI